MVSLLATGWLWSWRHALSEPWHFHIDIGRIQVCENSENPPKLQHLNWCYLMNRNLISSTVHGYFIVAKGHKTSHLNRLQHIWYLMGKLSQVCSQSPVITYVKTTIVLSNLTRKCNFIPVTENQNREVLSISHFWSGFFSYSGSFPKRIILITKIAQF